MKNFVVFLVLMALVICPRPNRGRFSEDRKKRRKEYEKQIVDCIINSARVSQELKSQLEENKNNDVREILREHFNKYDDNDHEVIRKCRREYYTKIRLMHKDILREKFNRNFTHRHFPEEHRFNPEYNHSGHYYGPEHSGHRNPDDEDHFNSTHRFPFQPHLSHRGEYPRPSRSGEFQHHYNEEHPRHSGEFQHHYNGEHPRHSGEFQHHYNGEHPHANHLPFGSRSADLPRSAHDSTPLKSGSASKPSTSNTPNPSKSAKPSGSNAEHKNAVGY